MLGKLIKHEWRGYKVSLIIIFAVLAVTTLLTGLMIQTINPDHDDVVSGLSLMITIFSIFLYYFGIIGCILGSMLVIAVRFYKTCYTDQGYLTHTLPASPVQILSSKIITAVLHYMLVAAGIVVSFIIIAMSAFFRGEQLNPSEFSNVSFGELYSEININFENEFGVSLTLYFIVILLFAIISLISTIIITLGCVSLGQLFTKHRIIGAIIAFFGVNTILQIISFVATIPMYIKIGAAEMYNQNMTPFEAISPSFLITILGTVVMAVIMYFVNLHMMTKKLNLE